MLYGNIDTISDMVNLKELSDYKLWFAYYSDDIYVPYKVDMWQYASDAKVNGITTDCDINLMFPEKTD
jgi:GH25 family lysozyme M1 (1,4-beta-N-acetylmuramidase)